MERAYSREPHAGNSRVQARTRRTLAPDRPPDGQQCSAMTHSKVGRVSTDSGDANVALRASEIATLAPTIVSRSTADGDGEKRYIVSLSFCEPTLTKRCTTTLPG